MSTNLLKAPLAILLSASAACSPAEPPQSPAGGDTAGAVTLPPDPSAPTGPSVPPAEVGAFQPAAASDVDALAGSNNTFASELYQALQARPGNLAMSPASVSIALAMTYAGASGATAEQMQKALRFELPADRLHAAFGTYLRDLAGDGKPRHYELRIANRLFGEKTVAFKDPFLAVAADHYQAPLEGLDFKGSPSPSRAAINAWVEMETKDKIRDLIPEGAITADTRLVLTNAIYFKGPWSVAFDKALTKDETFKAASGAVKVPMMHRTAQMSVADLDGLKVLELDYRGNDNSMIVVLPDADDGLAAIEKSLSRPTLDGWMTALRPGRVELSLPRFKLEPKEPIALKKVLGSMGMTLAFDPGRAEFQNMADLKGEPPLSIDDVYHKAFVEVNEEGTEAAAATGVVMVTRSAAIPTPPVVFRADHPFLFAIRDKSTGALLFVGRVVNPKE